MSEIKTGGPAFPCQDIVRRNDKGGYYGHTISSDGMSLRDYFAAKALQGLLAEPTAPGGTWFAHMLTPSFTSDAETLKSDRVAVAAYLIADSMLKARAA